MPVRAERWTTHFAYNNVTQIAMSPECVYAISDGSLYSVNKESEQLRIYNRQSGLHGTGITCIHYDETGKQLVIGYGNGKIDLLTSHGVKYVGELYDKDMTQRKTIHNVTIHNRTAYLSTAFGVQTFDLRENKLVDSYWLRANGKETDVEDVLVHGDSIYAFTTDSVYSGALSDNLVDYSVWKRELRSGRVSPETDKGKHYKDATSEWYAGQSEGIVRFTASERLTYKPQGPLSNIPYRMTLSKGKLWVLQGGRWASQYFRPGIVMMYDGEQWTNISSSAIQSKTGLPVLDFMNVAVDPKDNSHYFIPGYGTGLCEFRGKEVVRQHIAGGDNTLISAVEGAEKNYTRLDFATYDDSGNLWFLNAGTSSQLQCLDVNGQWHAVDLKDNGEPIEMYTPGGLLLDKRNMHHKWFGTARYNASLCLLDDKGTPFDGSDDRVVRRPSFKDLNGRAFEPNKIYTIFQDRRNRVWLGTDIGLGYIAAETDFFNSDAIAIPAITDENGENPFADQSITAICEDANGYIWVGTETLGAYVLNSDATEVLVHYTTDNSAFPANGILSLVADEDGKIYIGTSEGLVEFDPQASPESLQSVENKTSEQIMGSMQQWRLHLSYISPSEVAASPRRVYGLANGSLFSVDRTDGEIEYWNKSTGLNGNSISHIAYDPGSTSLVIAYTDGRVDLLSDEGNVKQIPDIYLKAGSISVNINNIYIGAKNVYLSMPFGIVVINTRKGEVVDTYYIGDEAASLDVSHVLEIGDTLYAFAVDKIYSASLKDNMTDYSFWHSSSLLTDRLHDADVHNGRIYTLQHDSLYVRQDNSWQLVSPQAIYWIHESGGQLLLYLGGPGICRLTDDGKISQVSTQCHIRDAVYSQGEYWLCEEGWGLIRLNKSGDNYYHSDGPNSNLGYFVTSAHNQMYSAVGGRWAAEYIRAASMNIYDGTNWRRYNPEYFERRLGARILDPVCIAVDPQNAGHFFLATYGTGVIEFRDYETYKHHHAQNSTLRPVNPNVLEEFYTRTDGAMIDEQGNLWVLNPTEIGQPIHILTPTGQWHAIMPRVNGVDLHFTTPSGIWPDKRDGRFKWMMDQRNTTGLLLLNDNGTPTIGSDDRCVKRNTFIDQNGNSLVPNQLRCFVQDHSNRVWLGTEKGIITIPSNVDFFTSNACRRIIIPRNDGTGLGDYLLGEEQINCMAVDGGNRIWIGTANSGLYLIEDDTITVAHFTENNSLLPSNNIQSIAIHANTGEVFVGTDKGIASYMSDASDAHEDMKGAYAFPNPVRPNYDGVISIAGLMDNTVVNIIDSGGNLVCKTRSHGGTAVWDGKLPDGRRATPGVYTALCNAVGGHAAVKILVIR